jgi:tRNA threonylcarbamoyladenosine biosynthesis protein TsaB
MLCPIASIILNNNYYQKYSNKKIHIIGDGAFKALNVLKLDFEYHPNIIPSAKNMGEISDMLFQLKKNENILLFEPFYLKK